MKTCLFTLLGLLGLAAGSAAAEPVDYVRDIKPVLSTHCYACHGPAKQRSGLRLDTAANLLKGGNAGPAIVAGKSKESRLIQAVTGADGIETMPPKGNARLTPAQIALLQAWIDQGAKVPPNEVTTDSAKRSQHWAFQPPVRQPLSQVNNATWCRNPIDHFILARLEKANIAPSPEADRATLIRRLSLDLLGLPPSVAEVDAFLADTRPDAYERLVDRLLASPHYGERWGRHWLDLARYADSNGFNIDAPRSIWKYRDWVIDALNRDLPFDQFTIEQIAGDLLPKARADQKIATGFHRNTLINQEGGIDVEQFRVESIVDRVNTTGSVFLGLTIGCAQCHDHKFDPISQREYYQLFAFYNNADEPTLELATPEQQRKRNSIHRQIADLEKQRKTFDTTTDESEAAWEAKLTPEERAKLSKELQRILALPENGRSVKEKQTLTAGYRKYDQIRHVVAGVADPWSFLMPLHFQAVILRSTADRRIADLKKTEPQIVTTMVMQERKTPRVTNVHLGGDFLRKGMQVSSNVPAVIGPASMTASPTRLDLARWLVSPSNPLTARVTMNRLWQHYFGIGLVETENDFGTQGTPPSHPELLDWLATEFVGQEWRMKSMHRLIVTSAVYRQSSRARPELATVDPRNRLLARQSRLRLDAEIVRDSALAASGLLSTQIGGPSVFPPQPEGIYRFTQVPRDWKANTGADRFRRGLYTYFWRSAPYPALTVFDAPGSTTTCTRRIRSNTPLQALTLLNDQAFLELAQGLAARVLREAQGTDGDSVRHLFRLSLGRPPSAKEQKRLERLLTEELAAFAAAPQDAKQLLPSPMPRDVSPAQFAALTVVARVLLNLDEFITRE
jgi:mono/diheme cytochrome c family protein